MSTWNEINETLKSWVNTLSPSSLTISAYSNSTPFFVPFINDYAIEYGCLTG